MSDQDRVLIIGGGVIGLSLAYHLAHLGAQNVVVLERNQLTSGTSWHAAGIVGPLRATFGMTKLAMRAMSLFPELEAETGLNTGYQQTTGYWIARRPERMDELERIAALANYSGMTPEIISGQEVTRRVPNIDPQTIVGALTLKEDGQVNPVDLCMAYAKAATRLGVEIREGVSVSDILVEGGKAKGVRLAGGEEILAGQVALCAGAWSKKLTDAVGVALPLQAVRHMYVVTEPIADLPKPYPVFRDMETHVYIKGDAGKLLIGWFEDNAKLWDPFGAEGDRPFLEMPDDWEQAEPFIEAALAMIPSLAQTGIQHFLNGPESFSHDSKPLVGETPEVDGLFVATAMNSVGVMSSAGIGRALAEWMIDGQPASDIWEIDIRRIDEKMSDPAFMASRMAEGVGNTFSMHWPYKQPKSGRNLRLSPLHDRLKDAGAEFGVGGAWERTLWFARDDGEKALPYSVGAQAWQPIADREAREMAQGVSLIDLSAFTKIDVEGPQALELLQQVCAGNIDVAIGRAVYTVMLNDSGGIESDLTVARRGESNFRVTSASATRRKDLAWLRRHGAMMGVSIKDVTENEAVIGVMGPRSREVLQDLSGSDWNDFVFSTFRHVKMAGVSVTATRISFVGELGWEISLPVSDAEILFDALRAKGAGLMGIYAMEGCRIEKKFHHWGHDLGPEITPLEAGLGFTVDFSKPGFLGKTALEAQKAEGLKRKLVLLEAKGAPLLLHDEPIWEGENTVGLTTSGAVGARTGKHLALGLIKIGTGEKLSATAGRKFRIQVGQKFHDATVLATPPYDPTGKKMRS
jgi:glycine cleavage system aminomethyltransferase T/glycine/D-amino acid oxidase-like deaminating enzyme